MNPVSKIAKLLRTPDKVLIDLENKMQKITGKKEVLDKIVKKHDENIKAKLEKLGLAGNRPLLAEKVYETLVDKVKKDNQALFGHFHKPDLSTQIGCRTLINAVKELTGDLTGFYLKKEKAKELFRLNPPRQIMKSLGYGGDVEKMLEREDIFELFCALRFVEEKDWLNNVFFKTYDILTKNDFEKRKIKVMVLPERWGKIGQKFMGKKLHHMSHLKELGLIFVIPATNSDLEKIIYLFFMTLHYSYEVDWHSRLFESYSQEKDFIKKMLNALKVEATSTPLPNEEKMSWRIVPNYLAKNDSNDFRLYEPHINPEAWFYTKTALAIEKFFRRFPEIGLGFWQDSDALAGYFPLDTANGKERALVSFDLFDNGISLLRQDVFENRQRYHQHEALWNKIFVDYIGEKTMESLMIENTNKGYVTLNS